MRIIFWGTPEYSIPSLENFIKSKHEVIAVVSQPDRKRSRGNKLISSPVKSIAEQKSIKIYTPEKIRGNIDFINELKSLSCDLFIVIAYGKILPKEILEIPKFGCWNAHASLLPRWRGAAPIQWSLIKGDEFTGVGIMKMNEGLDTGDLLLEEKIKIGNDDNLTTLSEKLSILSAKLFLNATSLIEENIYKNTNIKILNNNTSAEYRIEDIREIINFCRFTSPDTKFIIITHHALTMSRMDRLYGVTMAEQGISQLVSVDLQRAEELVA